MKNANLATLMGTTLGEVFLAAMLKDPAGAGHFIARAIENAESSEAAVEPSADKVRGRLHQSLRMLSD